MLIVKIEGKETIERAVKKLKRKFDNAKIGKFLRERKEFKKKSVKRRDQIKKAKYIQKLKDAEKNNG
jgi:small subunit ribosomal protein S21